MAVETALSILRAGERATFPPAIVISGTHAFLREDVFDTMRRRLLRDGMKYRGFQVGGAEGFDAVLAELREADLFAPMRAVACRVLRSHRGGAGQGEEDDGGPADGARSGERRTTRRRRPARAGEQPLAKRHSPRRSRRCVVRGR